MDMFACKCLNVSIHSKDGCQQIDVDQLKLTDAERTDPFFKKVLRRVILGNISKEQNALAATRVVGSWAINRCLNCDSDTHGVHRDRGANCVLIPTGLLTGGAHIASLRTHETFSPIFRILVDPKFIELDLNEDTVSVSHLPLGMQLSLNTLQQQMGETLKAEVAATEERIRKFSEAQYNTLEAFREKAHREYQSLLRLALSRQPRDGAARAEPPAEGAATQQDAPQPAPPRPRHPAVSSLSSRPRRAASRQLSQPARADSLDTEGLFFLEGMDDSSAATHSDLESDTDDSTSHDEGIHIPRQRTQSMSIAKSLPVNIPIFMSALAHDVQDAKPSVKAAAKEDAVDIAANIRALAKSVHGDAVFGDLPRPRFSTQI